MVYKTQKAQLIRQKKNNLLNVNFLPNKNKHSKKVKKLPTGRRLLQHVTTSREYINNSCKQSERDTTKSPAPKSPAPRGSATHLTFARGGEEVEQCAHTEEQTT